MNTRTQRRFRRMAYQFKAHLIGGAKASTDAFETAGLGAVPPLAPGGQDEKMPTADGRRRSLKPEEPLGGPAK
jgi:hypothetical protein